MIISYEDYAAKGGDLVGGGWKRDTFEDVKDKTLILVLKTYKELKLHYSDESKDKVVEGEQDNDWQWWTCILFTHWKSICKNLSMDWGLGLGGWEVDGV